MTWYHRLLDVMPDALRARTRNIYDMDRDIRDAHVLLVGRASEMESVYWSRIHDIHEQTCIASCSEIRNFPQSLIPST